MGNQKSKQEILRPHSTVPTSLSYQRRDSDAYNRYIRAPTEPSLKIYIALSDYQARSYNEISFKKGDELEVISAARNSYFMLVKCLDGTGTGFVPVKLVAEKDSFRVQE